MKKSESSIGSVIGRSFIFTTGVGDGLDIAVGEGLEAGGALLHADHKPAINRQPIIAAVDPQIRVLDSLTLFSMAIVTLAGLSGQFRKAATV
jgi:hypothetical protein